MVAQTGTVTAQNLTTPPFKATFASPPTIAHNTAVDVCFTADNSASQVIGILDGFPKNWFGIILNQGSQKLVFTAANTSSGTTTLVFPATLGTKTAVGTATTWVPPLIAAIQN